MADTAQLDTEVTEQDEWQGWSLTPAEHEMTVAKVAKLNDRAAAKGWTGRLEVVAERVEKRYYRATDPGAARTIVNGLPADHRGNILPGFWVTEIRYLTKVTGEAPSYGGYRFLASLDWDQHAGLIVRTAPGVESVDREGLAEGACAHCKTNRARRKTMLVENVETGEQVQVGSTCIKDFLGWSARPVFLYEDEVTKDVDEILGGFGGTREHVYGVESVLAAAWAATMAFGFVRSAEPGSTRDMVVLALGGRRPLKGDAEKLAAMAAHTEAAEAKGAEVRAFLLSDDFSGDSEYVLNMKAVAAADLASARNLGLLASAPQAWARAQELTLVRQRETDAIKDEWVGAEKDKLTVTGTVRTIRWVPDNYSYSGGSKPVYTILGDTGHLYTWFASSDVLGDDEGVTVTIKGTVKAHEEYQNTKRTVLTRCKLIGEIGAPVAAG